MPTSAGVLTIILITQAPYRLIVLDICDKLREAKRGVEDRIYELGERLTRDAISNVFEEYRRVVNEFLTRIAVSREEAASVNRALDALLNDVEDLTDALNEKYWWYSWHFVNGILNLLCSGELILDKYNVSDVLGEDVVKDLLRLAAKLIK